MTRVKRGTTAHKRRKKVLKQAKGFKWGRKSKYRAAKEAVYHALSLSFKGRKLKKRDFRRLWQTKISGGLSAFNAELSYSKFIYGLKQHNIQLNRKILAQLAEFHQEVFKELIGVVKK